MRLISALLIVAAIAQGASAQDVVDLRPQFVAGRWARYEFWVVRQQDNTTSAQGQTRSGQTRIEMTGELLWSVDRVAGDGSATCTMTLSWMTADLTLPSGERQRNDSRRPRGENEATHQMLRAMADVPLTVDVAADGSILAVRGVDAMQRRAPEGVTVPDELDFIETCTDLATLVAAPAQARVGDTWSTQFVWNHPFGKLRHDVRYALDSVGVVEGIPLATVSGSAKLKLDVDPSKLPGANQPDGPKVNVRMTRGSFSTQVQFDLDRHEAVGRNTVQETQVRVTISFMGRQATSTTDEVIQSQVLRIAEGG